MASALRTFPQTLDLFARLVWRHLGLAHMSGEICRYDPNPEKDGTEKYSFSQPTDARV
jgi:hypothetical protein